MATTVTLREITRETIREIELRDDGGDEPPIRDDLRPRILSVTRQIRELARRGPQPARRIGQVPVLLIADQRGGR